MTIINVQRLCVPKPAALRRGRSAFDTPGAMLLEDINCSVNGGEILAIIGPNGAGKSTLLKALAGDIGFDGLIRIAGLSATQTRCARQLGVLPQQSLLNFPYRVCEVVRLARIPHNTGRVRDDEIVDEALQLMDIGALKNRLYTQLSGGEKQRVQLARVLAQIWGAGDAANGTRVLLLDEPTTALDLGHQRDLMNVIQQFAKQGVAVIMALHDINLAARYADTMLALLSSKQVAYGAVADVVTPENIKRLFGICAEVMPHPRSGTPIVIGF